MPSNWLTFLLVLVVVYLAVLSVNRRRKAIRYKFRRLIILCLTYLGVVYGVSQAGRQPLEAIVAGVLAGLAVDSFIRPRSRYIPRLERRKVIARFELETGRKFNSRTHEVDHVIPFAQGGGNTADNLRVVARKENRSKGSKAPWWDLLGQ